MEEKPIREIVERRHDFGGIASISYRLLIFGITWLSCSLPQCVLLHHLIPCSRHRIDFGYNPLILVQNLRKHLSLPYLLLLNLRLSHLVLRKGLRVRVQPQQHLSILQRILLLHTRTLRQRSSLCRSNYGLNFA